MMRRPEWILAGVLAFALALLALVQGVRLARFGDERTQALHAAKRLASEVAGRDIPSPEQKPETASGRVFAAWDALPLPTESLSEWDLYLTPRAR